MKAQFFATPSEFREWLSKNYNKEDKLLVGYYKVKSKKPSMTWSESVDEALCFGWIDGVRKSIDDESYCIRFTPRKKTSIWSKVNIEKVTKLTQNGLMQSAGLKAFELRKENKSQIYAYEQKTVALSSEYEQIFKSNKTAWDFFITQAPSYQKKMIYRIISAKQEKTKISRLEKLIEASAQRKRID